MESASYDRVKVVTLEGAEPETFLILAGKSRHSAGFLWAVSLELVEREARDELAKLGRSISQTDALINKARSNPI